MKTHLNQINLIKENGKHNNIFPNIRCIYCIINNLNNKRYIGSTNNLKKRILQHRSYLNSKTHTNNKLQNAWNKYTINNFSVIIIEEVFDLNNLFLREQYYIDTLNPEYNILKSTYPCIKQQTTIEIRKKISKALTGIKRSNETKKRMSLSMRGHKVSNVTREKLRIWNKNRKKEQGPHVELYQYSIDGVLIQEYFSIKEAAENVGTSISNISNCINRHRKTACGFIWKRKKEVNFAS